MRKTDCNPAALQSLMEKAGLNQRTLAEKTDIPVTTIKAYLTGKRQTISTRNLLFLARAFEIEMSELIDILTNSQTI